MWRLWIARARACFLVGRKVFCTLYFMFIFGLLIQGWLSQRGRLSTAVSMFPMYVRYPILVARSVHILACRKRIMDHPVKWKKTSSEILVECRDRCNGRTGWLITKKFFLLSGLKKNKFWKLVFSLVWSYLYCILPC